MIQGKSLAFNFDIARRYAEHPHQLRYAERGGLPNHCPK